MDHTLVKEFKDRLFERFDGCEEELLEIVNIDILGLWNAFSEVFMDNEDLHIELGFRELDDDNSE